MPIRPIHQILDERPSLAKIDRQAKAIKRIQENVVAALPARFRAVAQLELSLHVVADQCTLYSANGTLCHALKGFHKQALRIAQAELPSINKLKIHKQNITPKMYKSTSPQGRDYWERENVGNSAIHSISTAAQCSSNPRLAEALANLANTLRTQKKRP